MDISCNVFSVADYTDDVILLESRDSVVEVVTVAITITVTISASASVSVSIVPRVLVVGVLIVGVVLPEDARVNAPTTRRTAATHRSRGNCVTLDVVVLLRAPARGTHALLA